MKNRIFYIMLLLMTVLACSDEFSETIEIGTLNPEALANEEGVNFLLTAAYSSLDGVTNASGGWEATGDNWWMDVISDDAHKGSTDGDQQTLFQLEVHDWSTGLSYISSKWRALYAGANRANAVIVQIAGAENGEILFQNQLAQARFLRGHYNFQLQIMWGKYATYISDENYSNVEFAQPNGTDLWANIDADFDYAQKNLPDSQSDYGRATNWAATAYLGKSKLYQGDYSAALGLLETVIGGPFSLLPEYIDNFRQAGEQGSESIFAIQFNTVGGAFAPNGNQGGTLNFGGPNGWCCGFYQPTQDLVNSFQTSAGLPLLDDYNKTDVKNDAGVESTEDFTLHTGPLDPRLDYVVGRRGINYNNWEIHPGKSWIRAGFGDISGPYLARKNVYWNGEDALQGAGNWGQQHSGINYHFIRLADVILMAAEAAIFTDDLAKGLDYINQIRSRAKNMTYMKDAGGADAANYEIELYTTLGDKTNAIKALQMERRLELGMEGHRLFDLRRWGDYPNTMNTYITNETRTISNFGPKTTAVGSKHNLLPVPVSAIDQSSGTLTQNPDW
ncbi:RagB/SusD family nutrient uptake outer membrane protein [Lutimonas sp.]|uniref:RagB/SusD family nutrient uptake outer membrane protein n=1 Tax=Lutimonas sp. TaxID=1872403 RepID=UPI003D9B44B8